MSRFLDQVEECVPALRRYARALTHNSDIADDLVQDCLERAIRKSGLWRPTGSLQAWLFKMLLNIHRNNLRQRRRAPDARCRAGDQHLLACEPHPLLRS